MNLLLFLIGLFSFGASITTSRTLRMGIPAAADFKTDRWPKQIQMLTREHNL
jgi:hypothetical protein